MNNVFAFTLLFELLAFAYAENPGKCLVRGKLYELGVHTDHDGCARITCGQRGFAEIATCGRQLVEAGCKLGNPLKPEADYHDCCEMEIICS